MARFLESSRVAISTSTFEQINDLISDMEATKQSVQPGMEILTSMLAYTNMAFAQELSRGPVDPRMKNRKAAWRIPVRRITGRYYRGWKVKRIKPNLWMTYNDSREAYFIEYGIHPTGSTRQTKKRGPGGYRGGTTYNLRVRRPIGKLSVIKTLRFVDQTRAGDRVLGVVTEPMRPGRTYANRAAPVAIEGMTARLGYLAQRRI